MSTARYTVVIERGVGDDSDYRDTAVGPSGHDGTGSDAVAQLVKELQEAWDSGAISGHFRVVRREVVDDTIPGMGMLPIDYRGDPDVESSPEQLAAEWRPSEDERFRYVEHHLDSVNWRDLLLSVVQGDVLFLDTPRNGGEMAGFVLRDCVPTFLASLNVGLSDGDENGDPSVWLAHDYVDWWANDHKPEGNGATLLRAIADENLEGIVDEAMGGIVAYVYPEYASEVIRVLNHTSDPTGVFGKLSQLGDIYPTADWGGEGAKPKATHWYWGSNNTWTAVIDEWETAWWEGADPADLASRPERWALPIWELPPSGLLCFNVNETEYHQIRPGERPGGARRDYNTCPDNPDGRHGPVVADYEDQANESTHVHVRCSACGLSTGYPIGEFADDLDWN